MIDRRLPGGENGESRRGDLAVVLTGGGARAAYQVGVLRAIARHFPALTIQVVTGVSAGAINAVYLCSRDASFARIVDDLAGHWDGLRTDDIFRSDSPSMRRMAARWALRLTSGGSKKLPDVKGLVDTAPLEGVLRGMLCAGGNEIIGLREKLARGGLKAVAVTTVSYTTGQTFTWVMGRGIELWERPNRRSVHARITIDHIMASSALPLIFPAVKLGDAWHGDGGIRLAAPLSPALHLGARRVLAMTTRYQQTFEEADLPKAPGYPPPIQIAGMLMNAIFLDVIDQDAYRLERLNALLRKLPEEQRDGLREIDLLVLRPSVDLGQLAAEYEPKVPPSLRFLLRGLGAQETSSADFLSLLLFEREYLHRLMEIGEKDGEARMEEIAALLDESAERPPLASPASATLAAD